MSVSTQVDPADVHLAGTPCTDFSTRGALQGLQGRTTAFLMCWIAQRLNLEDSYIIQENVVGFATELLQQTMGSMYHIDQAIFNPVDYGWGVARKRKYTIMRHKLKTGAFSQPLNAFSRIFVLDPPPAPDHVPMWDMYFVSGPRALREELLWACGRPNSSWQGQPQDLNPADCSEHGVFWQVLTDTEKQFLEEYKSKTPGQMYQLNQNPSFTATTSENTHMFTIIKNAGLLWLLGYISTKPFRT